MTTPDVPAVPEGPATPSQRDRQGGPGHDQAGERANAIRLLTLRAQKLTYKQIADEMGYADASGARHALLRALDRHEAENVQQLRTLENLAMDADERALVAIRGNTALPPSERISAVNALTRLRARRARLNGLDAPVQVALSAGVAAMLDDALAEAEEELAGGAGPTVPGEVTHVTDEPYDEPREA